MNVSNDNLKMLYQKSLKPVKSNGSGNATNGETSLIGAENSFLGVLNEVISKNSSSNPIVATTEKDKESSDNELSLAISMLMQQITGSNITDLQQSNQTNQILDILQNSDGLGIEALAGTNDNLYSNSSVTNIDMLIESLNQLKQGNAEGTKENILNANNTQATANSEIKSSRIFPKEIMDSINAARQAHELIRARIDQIRGITGITNAEDLLINGLTATDIEKLKLSLVLTDESGNVTPTDSILSTQESGNLRQDLFNAELISAEAVSQSMEESSSTSNDKSRVDIIDEGLINASVVNMREANTDNKANNISKDFASIKESVFEQIKDQVSMMRANDKQAVTMHLKPEELGKLDIRMILEKGNLSIEILTSNAKAHNLILSSIPELESVLKNSMATDRSFFSYENAKQLSEENARQNNQGYNEQHSQQQNSQQQDQNNPKNSYEELYAIDSENGEKLDFYTAFSKIREARAQILSKT
jgi:flagellar hook-length control protein FliK